MALFCVQLKNWLTTSREGSISFVHTLTCRVVSSVYLSMLVRSLSVMAKSWINKLKRWGPLTLPWVVSLFTLCHLFQLRRPRNYSHPCTQIGSPSDFPVHFLTVVMIYNSFKTARYDWSHVNPTNRVTIWNRHMAFTNSFVDHAHKYSHYPL